MNMNKLEKVLMEVEYRINGLSNMPQHPRIPNFFTFLSYTDKRFIRDYNKLIFKEVLDKMKQEHKRLNISETNENVIKL